MPPFLDPFLCLHVLKTHAWTPSQAEHPRATPQVKTLSQLASVSWRALTGGSEGIRILTRMYDQVSDI